MMIQVGLDLVRVEPRLVYEFTRSHHCILLSLFGELFFAKVFQLLVLTWEVCQEAHLYPRFLFNLSHIDFLL